MEPHAVVGLLRDLLTRLDALGQFTITDDEAAAWPAHGRDVLHAHGLVVAAAPARRVRCDQCDHSCTLEPTRRSTRDGRIDLVAPCPDAGQIVVQPGALRRWTLDLAALARICAEALGLALAGFQELLPGRLWRLGERRRGHRTSTVYLTWGLSSQPQAILPTAECLRASHPVVMLPALRPSPAQWPNPPGRVFLLNELLGFDGERLTLDAEALDLDEAETDASEGIVPIRTPAGTKWHHVTIRLVGDEVVEVVVAGATLRRTAGELGLLDRRKKPPAPGLIWANFRLLAQGGGVLDWTNRGASLKARQHIHVTRSVLALVFPDIEGSAIEDYEAGRGWRTAFRMVDGRRR